jgi:hemerythrin-like metal-binding protein
VDTLCGGAKPVGRNGAIVDQRGDAAIWAATAGSSFIRLVWQEAYECGEPTIDREHQQLFSLANSLLDVSRDSDSSPEALRSEFDKMVTHVVRHFAKEEALLAQHGHKDLEPHRLAHVELVARAMEFRRVVAAGRAKLGDLVEFLADTIIAQHIFTIDRVFFHLFRKLESHAMRDDLAGAVSGNELSLHYQPQARIGGAIVGFEALVRWRHRTRGMVYPDNFIPLAEETGLILPIGEWVLREACSEAASWSNPLTVAVNLSPIQFHHKDLVGLIHAILLETGLPPNRLELEITERVMLDRHSRALAILRRIKDLGVRIAMDDFGTGYSSLSYLQSFPFDKIKIDRSFVCNLGQNAQSSAIVRAIIGLGRELHLPVIAEGVETEDQRAFLAREHCHEIQGYLIGRPRPIADYADLVGRPASTLVVESQRPLARADLNLAESGGLSVDGSNTRALIERTDQAAAS